MPRRVQHADDLRIRVRHVFDADAPVAPDAHMLEHAVIDERERSPVSIEVRSTRPQ